MVQSNEKSFYYATSWPRHDHASQMRVEMLHPFVSLDFDGMTSLLSAQTLGYYAAQHPEKLAYWMTSFSIYLMGECKDGQTEFSEEKLRDFARRTATDFYNKLKGTAVHFPCSIHALDFSCLDQSNQEEGWFDQETFTEELYAYLHEFYHLYLDNIQLVLKILSKGLRFDDEERAQISKLISFFLNKTPFLIFDKGPLYEDKLFFYFPIEKMNEIILPHLKDYFTFSDSRIFFDEEVPKFYNLKALNVWQKLILPCIFIPGTTTPYKTLYTELTKSIDRTGPNHEETMSLIGTVYVPATCSLALSFSLSQKSWEQLFGFRPNEMPGIKAPDLNAL